PEITDVNFTVKMDSDLDEIEAGKEDWVNVIDQFYQEFSKRLEKAQDEIQEVEVKDELVGIDCEKCSSHITYRKASYVKFMECYNITECGNKQTNLKKIGFNCTKCKNGDVDIRKSKKGRSYYGCDQYPNCDFISWDKPVKKPCP